MFHSSKNMHLHALYFWPRWTAHSSTRRARTTVCVDIPRCSSSTTDRRYGVFFWPLQTSNHHRIKSPSTHRLRPTCCHCSCHVLSHRDVSQTITASKTLHHTGMINYIHIKHTNMITFGSIGELSVTLIETCNRRIGCVFFCRPNSSKEKETWTLSKTLLTTNWRPSSLRSKIKNQKRNQKQMRSPLMSRPRRPWRWVFTTKQELQPVVNA